MVCSSIIKVATLPSQVMQVLKKEDGRIELSGPEGKFLHMIIEALNLQLKIVISEDGEWGRLLENGSWTGMIGKIQQNKADIAINLLTITEDRARVVDFSTVYFTDDVTFAIQKQGFASTSTALIRPFDWTIWSLMFVVLLLMPLLFRFLTNYSYLHNLLKLFGAILYQSLNYVYKTLAHRILAITWVIYAMLLSFSFSSVLLSILTIPSQIPNVRNFEELSDAVAEQDYAAVFDRGTFVLDYLQHHENKHLRSLAESSVRKNHLRDGPLDFPIGKKSASVTTRGLLQVVAGPEEWKWHFLSEDTILSYKFGIAMKKGLCHKSRFNTVISRVNSAGLYFKIMNDAKFKYWLAYPVKKRSINIEARPLSLADLIGAFALCLFGLCIGVLALIIEIMCARFL